MLDIKKNQANTKILSIQWNERIFKTLQKYE
jgi:hypothetical protein